MILVIQTCPDFLLSSLVVFEFPFYFHVFYPESPSYIYTLSWKAVSFYCKTCLLIGLESQWLWWRDYRTLFRVSDISWSVSL